MSRQWIATLAAIWLTAVGSAVLLIGVLEHQRASEGATTTAPTAEVYPTQEADEPVVEATEAPVLEVPALTIVAPRPGGVAEMQGTDDLIIGPGIVTYPEAKQAPQDAPRRR
jgi:hypothetical protein